MGLLDKLKDALTETVEVPVKQPQRGIKDLFFEEEKPGQPKKSLKDLFFEEENTSKPKKGLWNIFFEEDEEPSIEFADSETIEDISKSIKGKLQDKKRELKMLGLALNAIDIQEFPGSKDVIKEYLELLNEQKSLSDEEANLEDDDIVGRVTLERRYDEFERKYNERIPRIKSLYFLREMRRQNKDMKLAFSTGKARDISEGQINGYLEYVKKISEQKGTFHSQYSAQLIDELVIAEYRLKMLMLMRDISMCEESDTNPFGRDTRAKKARFEEIFLDDFAESGGQYQTIDSRRKRYVKAQVLDDRTFDEMDRMAEELNTKMNNGVIDDFSISEVFENKGYNVLKTFIKLKIKMNEIDSRYDEVKDIENREYLNKKPRRKNQSWDDDGWQL